MNEVQIWWVGVECRQRQEAVDEVFGTVDLVSIDGKHHESHKFPEDADYWSFGPDQQRIFNTHTLLYSGPAQELALAASLVEWDSGDIQQYKDAAAQAVSAVASAALGAATGGGGALAKPLVDLLAEALVDLATDVLGTEADKYPPGAIRLMPAGMLFGAERRRTLRRADDQKTISFTDEIVVTGTDDGGDRGEYAIYFDIRGPGWGQAYAMAPAGAAVPGAVTAVSRHRQHLDLFWAAPDGGVVARSWNGREWSDPYLVVPGNAGNARTITAASRFAEHLDLFWTTADGGVGARSWTAGAGWGEPYPMAPPGSAAPTGAVAAEARHRDHLDLFWAAPDGGVVARSWNGREWSDPYLVVPGNAGNARTVAAASRFEEHLDLFWTTADGGVGALSWSAGAGWGEPYPMAPPGSAAPTGAVAAESRHRDHLDLFWAAPDGGVVARSWNGREWSDPYLVVPGNAGNARAVAAASRFEEHLDLFWTTADGGIGARSWME
jgi:hypothetical protein